MKANLGKKVALGLTVGILTVGGVATAYAAGDQAVQATGNFETIAIRRGPVGMEMGYGRQGGFVRMDFANLVEIGVVDQATADRMAEYVEARKADMLAQFEAESEALQSMEADERKVYVEARKEEAPDDQFDSLFAGMIQEGILTEAQTAAIQDAMPAHGERGLVMKHMGFGRYVEEGIISQEKADAIWKYLENRDIMAELVEAGLLTQAEADAIKAAEPEKKKDIFFIETKER